MNDVLPDLLDHGLILLFCGTAASDVSARAGAYYANPTNAFWPILHACGITPSQMMPSDFRDLLALRIGLTDLYKRSSGADRFLRPQSMQRERLRGSVRRYQPQIVAFTSKAAWRGWMGLSRHDAVACGWQGETLGKTAFYVLPSPSGAARAYWDLAPWRVLGDEYLRRLGAS